MCCRHAQDLGQIRLHMVGDSVPVRTSNLCQCACSATSQSRVHSTVVAFVMRSYSPYYPVIEM
jgi:hypothetical protein